MWYVHSHSTMVIRVIRKKLNILYFNFGCKYDLQIQIIAIFRKKDFGNIQNGRPREIQIFDCFWL